MNVRQSVQVGHFLSQELSAEIGDYLGVDGLINHKNAKF
jgi:hypothetical protein